ncbi:MAG: M57 family metalloprotease [Ginsengibacter sp.]
MRVRSNAFLGILAVGFVFVSCQKEEKLMPQVSQTVLNQIAQLGFSTDGVHQVNNGYLVEGDILLTDANLREPSNSPTLLIADEEQYRTTNLVTSLPRTITVSVSGTLTSLQVWSDAADAAIARYNALPNTRLVFQRVASGGNIDIFGFNEGPSGGYITLGSSGFPTGGNPFNQIKMNTNTQAYGSNPNLGYVTSVIQHEMGHCIGFRHTDYFNRSLSCGGFKFNSNEGKSTVGAIRIPGTPSKTDKLSFMQACSNGSDRTFSANDKIAMDYLY